MTAQDDAAIVALAMILDRCVNMGNDLPHPSAMIGLYFGARCEQIAPDFAESLRHAFDRTFQTSAGVPAELVEEQFRTAIEQMASAWRGHGR